MNEAFGLSKFMVEPPVHELHDEQRTFATIWPLEMPEPARRVTLVVVSCRGMTSPRPWRGDKVTLSPAALEYITNMLEPAIRLP